MSSVLKHKPSAWPPRSGLPPFGGGRGERLPIRSTLRARGICVVIPTYNNVGTLRDVVTETLRYSDDVYVVDDGSTDDSADVLAAIEGIRVVTHTVNKGKGHALRSGFRQALADGFSYAITLDSDGQHYPDDIPQLLKANQEHPGCLIVGSRNLEGVERTAGSSFANKFSNFWFYVQTGRRLSDTQTGYRLYPLKKLRGLSLLTSRYEAELELMVLASWHGVQLVETPVKVFYPPKEERVTHFRPFWDFARISVLNTVLCFLAVVYGLPLRLWRWLMRWLRTAYSALTFGFFSLFVCNPLIWLYLKCGKITEKKRRWLHQFILRFARFITLRHGIPGAKFSYSVEDGVDFNKPSVIICNHQSHLDLVCQLIFTPNIIFLTNDWVWKNPFYGMVIRNAEYYPVSEGIDKLLPNLRSLVERGYSIAVFPEGTRSKDCSIARFHQGPFYMADQLGVDILPMCLYGAGKVLPKGGRWLRKGPIHIEVEKPVSREELDAMGGYRQQASELRKRYLKKYEELCNKIEQDV